MHASWTIKKLGHLHSISQIRSFAISPSLQLLLFFCFIKSPTLSTTGNATAVERSYYPRTSLKLTFKPSLPATTHTLVVVVHFHTPGTTSACFHPTCILGAPHLLSLAPGYAYSPKNE